MSELKEIKLEYVYVTIPAEYICIYHRILAMMADYGEDMLKDCKASCTDKNSGVIECFNMFNSAVAARKLGKDKLAEVLIKYIKNKINQIYKGKDNSTSFVFPVDENGQLKAFVSCGERPRFRINPEDMNLYEHKLNNGFTEHFHLGIEDESKDEEESTFPVEDFGLQVDFTPLYEKVNDTIRPCIELQIKFDEKEINPDEAIINYYFDDIEVIKFNDVVNPSTGVHNFKVVVTYNKETKIISKNLYYAITD